MVSRVKWDKVPVGKLSGNKHGFCSQLWGDFPLGPSPPPPQTKKQAKLKCVEFLVSTLTTLHPASSSSIALLATHHQFWVCSPTVSDGISFSGGPLLGPPVVPFYPFLGRVPLLK